MKPRLVTEKCLISEADVGPSIDSSGKLGHQASPELLFFSLRADRQGGVIVGTGRHFVFHINADNNNVDVQRIKSSIGQFAPQHHYCCVSQLNDRRLILLTNIHDTWFPIIGYPDSDGIVVFTDENVSKIESLNDDGEILVGCGDFPLAPSRPSPHATVIRYRLCPEFRGMEVVGSLRVAGVGIMAIAVSLDSSSVVVASGSRDQKVGFLTSISVSQDDWSINEVTNCDFSFWTGVAISSGYVAVSSSSSIEFRESRDIARLAFELGPFDTARKRIRLVRFRITQYRQSSILLTNTGHLYKSERPWISGPPELSVQLDGFEEVEDVEFLTQTRFASISRTGLLRIYEF